MPFDSFHFTGSRQQIYSFFKNRVWFLLDSAIIMKNFSISTFLVHELHDWPRRSGKLTLNHHKRRIRGNISVKNAYIFHRCAWSSIAIVRRKLNTILDEKLLLLYEKNSSKNTEFEYSEYEQFELDKLGDAEWKANFRVEKRYLPTLCEALQIPGVLKRNQRSIAGGIEGLCMLLKRSAYPCRYRISYRCLENRCLSVVWSRTMFWTEIYSNQLITEWNNSLLSPNLLEVYANAVNKKGAALQNWFGFIDDTVCRIANPGKNQRIVYHWHIRVHSLKFQSIVTPNGMIANLYGPVGKFTINHILFF